MAVRLAILNSMAGPDIERSVAVQAGLGLRDVDLKDGLFGKGILDLTDAEAKRLRVLFDAHGMAVHCLSTQLFGDGVERGQSYFSGCARDGAERAGVLAGILGARMVRLLGCQDRSRPAGVDLAGYLDGRAPWVLESYREGIRRLAAAGAQVTVENEVGDCVLATPEDVSSFFGALDSGAAASFTWDVQNMWSLGTAPSAEVYERLRPLIGYVHLKGGRAGPDGRLAWRSSLRDASWPVVSIVRAVVADGVSPVICLNPSHGRQPPGWDPDRVVADDVSFVRELCAEVAR